MKNALVDSGKEIQYLSEPLTKEELTKLWYCDITSRCFSWDLLSHASWFAYKYRYMLDGFLQKGILYQYRGFLITEGRPKLLLELRLPEQGPAIPHLYLLVHTHATP